MAEAREYLIRKDGYFYRPNKCGYTTAKIDAGRYTKADAEAEASVEPWHMSAVHQDDVPDDAPSRSIKDKDAEIENLRREVQQLRDDTDIINTGALEWVRRATAAEAECTRLRAELERKDEVLKTIAMHSYLDENASDRARAAHWCTEAMRAREIARRALQPGYASQIGGEDA